MKRFFFHSIQGRVIFIFLLLMTVSLLATIFIVQHVSQQIISSEKANKLLEAASLLDFHLGEKTYEDILAEHGAEDGTREEKIALLNRELSAVGDFMTTRYPDQGIGYYSLELDAILTYAPSEQYKATIGQSIAPDHPGRIAMANNEPLVRTGTMVRGNIMNAMCPIARDGKVIGYAWANELTSSIETEYRSTTASILIVMIALYLFSIAMAITLARLSMRDIDSIVKGVRSLRSNLNDVIPLPKSGGDLAEIVQSINTMAADISKAEEDHKALLLAEASNLAQRDFLARMSHELRTPMNGVLGMTKLAQSAKTDSERLEYLAKIHASASLLLGIINDILDISKIEANKMEIERRPFKIMDIIENIRDLLTPRALEKHLQFDITVDPSVPKSVAGDSLRLSQVLFNIVGNAIKFTQEGSVSLHVFGEELQDNKIKLSFSVRDAGIGMDEAQLSRVFKAFTQADSSTARKFGGSGLGLSISKALTELMGGELHATSEKNVGSEFALYVIVERVSDTEENELNEEQSDVFIQNYTGFHLLLVEDNPLNQEIGKAVLEEMGFKVTLADNGEEGVKAFKAARYDLIFMDIRMPVMDGLEATRAIRAIERERAEPSRIPIIAMTANVMASDKEATHLAGMDDHVSKPLDIDEIRLALYKALIK